MSFLSRELDDPDIAPCGRCAPCQGRPLLPATVTGAVVAAAISFLRMKPALLEPRGYWPGSTLNAYGWSGIILPDSRMEQGRVLSVWGDAGWGMMVRQGKQESHRFADDLVAAAAELIRGWAPEPAPRWVTFVPSRRDSDLVKDLALRVGAALDLPVVDCVSIEAVTPAQKTMRNSTRQARNAAQTFFVKPENVLNRPVLLVDDVVDSRWTMTVVAARLRQAGSGVVFPFALSYAGVE